MRNFLKPRRSPRWSSLSDEALAAHYRRHGEEGAIAELFGRYVHLVYGACRNFLPNKSAEEWRDQVMVVFERVAVYARESKIEAFNTWVFAITRNECFSRLREQERTSRYQQDWENFEKSTASVMENGGLLRLYQVEEPNAGQLLENALANLEEGQRRCIELFYREKKSYQEIAAATGFTLKQVKSHLQNAKRRLQNELGGPLQSEQSKL